MTVALLITMSIFSNLACGEVPKEEVSASLVEKYALESAPDSYAGVYTDRQGLVRVGFTQDSEQHFSDIKAHFNNPEKLQLFSATYSEAQLDETTKITTMDAAHLRDEGIMVYAVGPNIPDNRVDVTVMSADAGTISILQNRYGSQVNVIVGSAPVPT